MKAYSLDLRERVVAAVAGGQSCLDAARRFAVGRSTVQRWVRQHAREGSLSPKPIPCRPRKISPAAEAALAVQAQATPDATLAEHCARWEAQAGVRVSVATMHHALARLGWSLKKSPSGRLSKIP
jgi:transposase